MVRTGCSWRRIRRRNTLRFALSERLAATLGRVKPSIRKRGRSRFPAERCSVPRGRISAPHLARRVRRRRRRTLVPDTQSRRLIQGIPGPAPAGSGKHYRRSGDLGPCPHTAARRGPDLINDAPAPQIEIRAGPGSPLETRKPRSRSRPALSSRTNMDRRHARAEHAATICSRIRLQILAFGV